MGRPKGSKNKKTIEFERTIRTPDEIRKLAKDWKKEVPDLKDTEPYTKVYYTDKNGTQVVEFPLDEKPEPHFKWVLLGVLGLVLIVEIVRLFSR